MNWSQLSDKERQTLIQEMATAGFTSLGDMEEYYDSLQELDEEDGQPYQPQPTSTSSATPTTGKQYYIKPDGGIGIKEANTYGNGSWLSKLVSKFVDKEKIAERVPGEDAIRGGTKNWIDAVHKYLTNDDNYVQNRISQYEQDLKDGMLDPEESYLETLKVHEDAKRTYLGLPQLYNSLEPSPYRPTIGTSENPYQVNALLTDREFEDTILPLYSAWKTGEHSYVHNTEGRVSDLGKTAQLRDIPHLQAAGLSEGYDNKGQYISLYDVWDYNTGIKNTNGDNIGKWIGGKPFDIYQRYYLDDWLDTPEEARGNPYIAPAYIESEYQPYPEHLPTEFVGDGFARGGKLSVKPTNTKNLRTKQYDEGGDTNNPYSLSDIIRRALAAETAVGRKLLSNVAQNNDIVRDGGPSSVKQAIKAAIYGGEEANRGVDAFLYGPESQGYTEQQETNGHNYDAYISKNYPDRQIKSYTGVINPFEDYVVPKELSGIFQELAKAGKTLYSAADREYEHFDELPYRDDVANYALRINSDNRGRLLISASDLFDFNPNEYGIKYGKGFLNSLAKTLGAEAYTAYGNPYILRQDNIPIKFVDKNDDDYEASKDFVDALMWANTPDTVDKKDRSAVQKAFVEKLSTILGRDLSDDEKSLFNRTYASGGKIHIKPENRGKFTALKKRTGHSATWFKQHGTLAQKKMATFALNSKHWSHKHTDGGYLQDYRQSYELGGVYDLSEEQVQELIRQGYEVEQV